MIQAVKGSFIKKPLVGKSNLIFRSKSGKMEEIREEKIVLGRIIREIDKWR
jgi:hypothetical protein